MHKAEMAMTVPLFLDVCSRSLRLMGDTFLSQEEIILTNHKKCTLHSTHLISFLRREGKDKYIIKIACSITTLSNP